MSAGIFPISILYEDTVSLFASESTALNVVFGKRELAKQINQAAARAGRVVFVPGMDGKMGSFAGARKPGQNPRPLKTILETCSVYVWGYDPSDPNNEKLQYEAARYALDATIRSIELSARSATHANLELEYGDLEEVRPNIERTFGFELRFSLTARCSVFDSTFTTVTPGEGQLGVSMGFPSGDFVDSPEIIPQA